MVKYICDKCNKEFAHKNNYTKHANRKYSCVDEDRLIKCMKCDAIFKSRSTLWRHKKDCTGIVQSSNIVNNTINDNSKTINNIDNSVNNNLKLDGDVKLVKFGNENLSYISDDIFKSIMGRGFKSIEELVDHSHFNPDHPENHNIYIANIQSDFVIIYDGIKWNIDKKEDIFEDIIYAKSDFLCMKFKELMSQMTEIDVKKFTNFINERDEDKTMNKIKGELKLQLYNNRGLPQKLRKQMESNEREMQKSIKNKKSKKIQNVKLKEAIEMMEHLDDSKVEKLCTILNSL